MKRIWWLVGGSCLVFGIISYMLMYKHNVPIEESIPQANLRVSGNQDGYPTSNLGVSIHCKGKAGEKEKIEFVVENNSNTEWCWCPNIRVNERNGVSIIEETGLEIELDDIWYDIPLKEDLVFTLAEYFLLPNSSNIISFYESSYFTLIPGKYRYAITIYNDSNEFNLSAEFIITEEE